jgi:hypothetical protein
MFKLKKDRFAYLRRRILNKISIRTRNADKLGVVLTEKVVEG